jgi:hypothetical protein
MFSVQISAEAKAFVAEQFTREKLNRPGLMIGRQGPVADVIRTSDGQTKWNIEYLHPWRTQVFEIDDHNVDLVDVEGISIWLVLIPKLGELGVNVTLRDGKLFVEALTP